MLIICLGNKGNSGLIPLRVMVSQERLQKGWSYEGKPWGDAWQAELEGVRDWKNSISERGCHDFGKEQVGL